MTSIDRTIYRRMKCSYTTKELIETYTPTEEERRFVSTMTRTAPKPIEPHAATIKLFPYSTRADEYPG
jgi:hypothetical protein